MYLKKGFTLIENIAVVSILGAVFAVSLPHLIRYNTNTNKQIKVRRAVTNYQVALTKELLHSSGIRATGDFNNYLSADNYSSIVDRFSTKRSDCGENSCSFTTDDNVVWNVTNPSRAVISLDKSFNPTLALAADENNKDVFVIPYEIINGRLKILLVSETYNAALLGAVYKTRSFINE